jgi:hypothetical protein
MNATRRMAGLALLSLCLVCANASRLAAQAASGGTAGQGSSAAAGGACKYTMAEYNAEQAAAAEKNPGAQVKLLDDFVAKYPSSCLMNYVYPLYYQNYYAQKNFPKVIEYANKELTVSGISATDKYQAYTAIVYAYNNISNPDAATAKAVYQSAQDGVASVGALTKPDSLTEDQFNQEKKKAILTFNGTAAKAAMDSKDYANAVQMYKTILATNPDDFVSDYQMGRAYSAMNPPQTLDALWSYARAATAKTATEQQSAQVKAYIPKAIANYQGGNVCDSITQAESNELLQLASSSVDRPASYKLFSSADLTAAQKDMTIASVVTDLKAGGDKAKLTWTASCGLEFPDVPGKIISVDAGPDTVTIKLAFVTSDAEFEAATNPDMEVKVKIADQPDAAKVEKDNYMRFTGTLETYDPDPSFMLHWDKAKVNDEDLPKPGKKPTGKKPAAKKPS